MILKYSWGQLMANQKEVVYLEEGNVVVINTDRFTAYTKKESVKTILK
jgi:hypothetical protein